MVNMHQIQDMYLSQLLSNSIKDTRMSENKQSIHRMMTFKGHY